eukprot:TRINITY_DN4966_c0_g1_i2.p1 TRINITY_DN4966_c0_g1~~TRINITY_DN4966_c0_g1_i2.p1  ORF type:complete len:313 (+),score=81.35 TRINITY_DN4966_c0_g1_i2:41-940(+)
MADQYSFPPPPEEAQQAFQPQQGSVQMQQQAPAQIISQQPQIMPFGPNSFTDTSSGQLYSGLRGAHKSHKKVQQSVMESGMVAQTASQQHYRGMLADMPYEAFLAGLLHPGEQSVQGGTFLDYVKVELYDHRSNTLVQQFPPGKLMLTNKRLLFLSSSKVISNRLASFGDPKKLPGGYTVSSQVEDVRFFWPMGLSNLHLVQMKVDVGVQADVHVEAQPPPCCGMCFCCTKNWLASPPALMSKNNQTIELAATLPPWNTERLVRIEFASHVPFDLLKQFLTHFQGLSGEATLYRTSSEA